MKKEKNNIGNNIFKIITILMTILLIIFIIYSIQLGIFQDKMIMVNYIKKYGVLGPLLFMLIQIVQVIFPVIPGGASCLAGVLAFGPILGFIYNYIGLTLGSTVAFYLSRTYGLKLIKKLFKKETINKYLKYLKNNKFEKIFIIGIFAPGLPDDLLCYIAGISDMTYKKFIIIILLGKPLALIIYSIFIHLL